MSDKFKLHFLGGAGTVTGSKTVIEVGNTKVMVDCGLFQGLKALRLKNRESLPIDASEIDVIILTHAHLDHCGYLPVMVRNGFKGKIYCTHPTEKLTEIILIDSAKIQEEDADRANRYAYTRHEVAKPLYTQEDVHKTLRLFSTHNYDEWVIIDNDIKFQLVNSGHILGSAMVELKVGTRHVVFSGDIGRSDPMLLYPPKRIREIDYLIMESTYGDRLHRIESPKKGLLSAIEATYRKGGILMIPSFAVERTQEILYLIYLLREEGMMPNMPVYVDSPMGTNSTMVFAEYPEWQDLSKEHSSEMYMDVHFIRSYEESKQVCSDKKPKIVLAGSGMLEGGRIIHYLNNHMGSQKNTLLFVGFQAAGTRGRSIIQGESHIKFFGDYHEVKCEVRSISSMSAHGDQLEMLEWMKEIRSESVHVFLNHGEPHQTNSFRTKIETTFGWKVDIPELNQVYELNLK